MTPADRRITELIDKWLASIDLHLSYVELSDAAYARAQAWPKHDRPTRWVLEVARQKILELQEHCAARQTMSDGKFAESLELMAFLANLVGIQHIQRFIPLAEPARAGSVDARAPGDTATVVTSAAAKPAQPEEPTREMPRLKPAAKTAPAAPAPKPAARAPGIAPKAGTPKPSPSPAPTGKPLPADINSKIIADAIRLLKWGKSWHELADLIGRIADRPPVPEIRKVLRAHKSEIETKVAQG